MGVDEGGSEDAGTALSDVTQPLREALSNVKKYIIDWVKRRNILIQFMIAGLAGELVRQVLTLLDKPLLSVFPTFTATQILIAILGVLVTQTVVQRKKLNELQDKVVSMNPPVTDGGRQKPRKEPQEDEGTSGGAALGGAIAGGALGAAYGPQGAVAGAILGDNFEEDSDARSQ